MKSKSTYPSSSYACLTPNPLIKTPKLNYHSNRNRKNSFTISTTTRKVRPASSFDVVKSVTRELELLKKLSLSRENPNLIQPPKIESIPPTSSPDFELAFNDTIDFCTNVFIPDSKNENIQKLISEKTRLLLLLAKLMQDLDEINNIDSYDQTRLLDMFRANLMRPIPPEHLKVYPLDYMDQIRDPFWTNLFFIYQLMTLFIRNYSKVKPFPSLFLKEIIGLTALPYSLERQQVSIFLTNYVNRFPESLNLIIPMIKSQLFQVQLGYLSPYAAASTISFVTTLLNNTKNGSLLELVKEFVFPLMSHNYFQFFRLQYQHAVEVAFMNSKASKEAFCKRLLNFFPVQSPSKQKAFVMMVFSLVKLMSKEECRRFGERFTAFLRELVVSPLANVVEAALDYLASDSLMLVEYPVYSSKPLIDALVTTSSSHWSEEIRAKAVATIRHLDKLREVELGTQNTSSFALKLARGNLLRQWIFIAKLVSDVVPIEEFNERLEKLKKEDMTQMKSIEKRRLTTKDRRYSDVVPLKSPQKTDKTSKIAA